MRDARLRSRLWPTIAAAVGVALTVALGYWQLGRAAEKRETKARYEVQASQPPIHVGSEELPARDIDLRHVEAHGVFEPRFGIFVDNRIHHGVPGYYVVMPLRLDGSERFVLVNRGWIARPALRSELPQVRTPREAVTVSGTAIIPSRRFFELSNAVIEGAIWQNLTIERYRNAMPISVQPFVIQQVSALDDGLVREWDPPDFGIDRHYGYAFQWFALAATIIGFYVVTHFRRKRAASA